MRSTQGGVLPVVLHGSRVSELRLDGSVPEDLHERTKIRVRDKFFGPGYAKGTDETFEAIAFARSEFDLTLEPTYTGKAMAALVHDLRNSRLAGENLLFWNTYNSRPLPAAEATVAGVPEEFQRYF